MLEFRRFSKEDWYAWSGAESWRNGADPLIARDGSNLVVVDREGCQVMFGTGSSYGSGRHGLAFALRPGFTEAEVKALGFTPI